MNQLLKPTRRLIVPKTFFGMYAAEMRKHFIKFEDFIKASSVGVTGGMNIIFWGEGGYGKSEGLDAMLHLIEEDEDKIFTQTCDEGMTPERLFGGIDLNAMDDPEWKRIQFNVENSFLGARYTVLEEGLDMPEQTIASLKDTMTKKVFRNGKQKAAMLCESMFVNTNVEPKEKVTMGNTTKALLSRFAIQVRIGWESHTAADYQMLSAAEDLEEALPERGFLARALREAQERFKSLDIRDSNGVLAMLAEEAAQYGPPLSPRAFKAAKRIVKASAAMNGRDSIETRDLEMLVYSPEFEAFENLAQSIRTVVAKDETVRLAKALTAQRIDLEARFQTALDATDMDLVDSLTQELNALDEQINDSSYADVVSDLLQKHQAEASVAARNTKEAA